jgi:hypothetical protein
LASSTTDTASSAPSASSATASLSTLDPAGAHALHVQHNSDEIAKEEERLFGLQQRTEWAKARARHQRWLEEQELTMEEMRRTAVYLTHRADWWRAQKNRRRNMDVLPSDDPTWRVWSGCNAYCERQALLVTGLRDKFLTSWRPVLRDLGLYPDWMALYDTRDSPRTTARALSEPGDPLTEAGPPSSPGLVVTSSGGRAAGDENEDGVRVAQTEGRVKPGVGARPEDDLVSSDDDDSKSSEGSQELDEQDDEDETAGLDFTEG